MWYPYDSEDTELSILLSRKKQIEDQIRELTRELNQIEMRIQSKSSPQSWVYTIKDSKDIPNVTL